MLLLCMYWIFAYTASFYIILNLIDPFPFFLLVIVYYSLVFTPTPALEPRQMYLKNDR